MKKKLIGLTILAAMVVFACAGCAMIHENGPDDAKPAVNSGVTSTAPDTNPTDSSSAEEPGGGVEKMDVTINIDGEDYAFPMPYAEFEARGWTLSYGSELWEDGLYPGYHRGSLFFSKGDIKALEIVFNNPTEAFQHYADCEVAGIRVNYDQQIDGKNAELVMNIPVGSIQVNGQGIGEADRDEIVAAFGEDATFVMGVPADSMQISDQQSTEANGGDVAILGKDWDEGYDGDADLNDFDTFFWWLGRDERNEGNDDTLTLSFDETGLFTEMTFLKTK